MEEIKCEKYNEMKHNMWSEADAKYRDNSSIDIDHERWYKDRRRKQIKVKECQNMYNHDIWYVADF